MDFTLIERMWFADFEDDSAEEAAAQSLAATVGVLRGVLPIPAVATKLIRMVNDPNYKSDAVAALISSDAGLSSKLLQVVNSSSYALRSTCNSIAHAVVLLGPKTVREIAVALSVLGIFNDKGGQGARILEHSAAVAGMAVKLSAYCERLQGLDIYSCALLHDIGKLLMLQADPSYADLLQECDAPDQIHLLEREKYGYDHAVLAGHVLAEWNIPDPIPTALAWHHKPKRAFEENSQTSAIVAAVRLADRLDYLLASDADQSQIITDLMSQKSAAFLDLLPRDVERLWPELVALRSESHLSKAA